MAIPSYTEDLTDIATADGSTGWVELTGTDGDGNAYNVQGAPAYQDNEYPYIQGSFAVTQDTTKSTAVGSLAFSAGSITVPTDGAVLVWHNYSSPFAFGTYAQGGYRICVGSGSSDFKVWFVGGNDKGRMPYGGFENHAVNPTVTQDRTVGTPTATLNYVGSAVYIVSGPSKGEPHQVDAMRYGRCSSIFEFGQAANYATLAGFATQNDLQANRWGLIQAAPGSYLWKGRMQLGTVTNAVDFRDSNKSVSIDWTPKVTANFNLIEIINASSNIEMTGFTFTCLDTTSVSKGRLLMTGNAVTALTSCSFIDMDTFVFLSNATIMTSIFRRCGLITLGGGTLTNSDIENCTATTSVKDTLLANTTGCTFTSDGSNHAFELTSIGAGSMDWDNSLVGYVAGSAGSPVTPTSTGNEAIYVNVATASDLTINVATGASIPSIRVGASFTGSVNVVAGAVTVKATAVLKAGTPVETARVYLKASNGTGPFPFEETVTITRSTTLATVAHTAHGMATNDKIVLKGITDKIEDNYRVIQITVTGANAYTFATTDSGSTSYTGTILSTFVALNGVTDVNGELSISRTYPSNQPVTGWTRKSTTSPYLQEGILNGVVDSVLGFNGTAVMLADE